MHEHIARSMYYLSIHLLFASIVAAAALALTSTLRASATTKYWVWVAVALNFVVPSGAIIDRIGATHFPFAHPIGIIGGPVWDLTQGRVAVILALAWVTGAFCMFVRLLFRIVQERRDLKSASVSSDRSRSQECNFLAEGVEVTFGDAHASPAVLGVLSPRVLLPTGLDRVLNARELHAVLIHELAHARRRDNLIRLVYEISLCALWFHPLLWLAGARIALYRELSCDESVVDRAHGQELVSALAKLAVPPHAGVLQASASSHLSDRLALLAAPARRTHRGASLLLACAFSTVIVAGVFQTIAHTACCFVLKH